MGTCQLQTKKSSREDTEKGYFIIRSIFRDILALYAILCSIFHPGNKKAVIQRGSEGDNMEIIFVDVKSVKLLSF